MGGHGLRLVDLDMDSPPITFQARILLGLDEKEAD